MAFFNGLMYVFKEIAKRAENERWDEEGTRDELVRLHQAIESGALTEEEFERRETELLERLEEIAEHKRQGGTHGGRQA
jgi:hypothetical protein